MKESELRSKIEDIEERIKACEHSLRRLTSIKKRSRTEESHFLTFKAWLPDLRKKLENLQRQLP